MQQRAPLLLVGLGGVGLMGLALARAMYGTAPFVADIDGKKREAALAAGAAQAFDPSDPNARKALLKASGGIYAACDFAGSDASLNFATGVLAKGGKVIVTGLIGGAYSTAVAMFPLKAMTIEGTTTGTLSEARELIDLVRAKNITPPPIAERPLDAGVSHARRPARGKNRRARRPDSLELCLQAAHEVGQDRAGVRA